MKDSNLMIKVKRRTPPQWLVLWIAVFPLLWGFLFSFLNVPGVLKYTADIIWIFLLLIFVFRKKTIIDKKTLPLFLLVITFFIYVSVAYLFKFQSPLYFLWGVRNNFRYYVFFFSVAALLSQEDGISVLALFDFFFWINAAVTFIQYFVLGYKGDFLGGIFGIGMGCNAYSIIFFVIVVAYSLLRYMNKRECAISCFAKCGVSLIISAFAELKFFFVLFVFILIMTSVVTSFSWKKVLIIATAALMLFIGSIVLDEVVGAESFLSWENIWRLATQQNYNAEKTVNRLSAIPTLSELILKEPQEQIFGLGMGNCETSTFKFLSTPFYNQYSYLRYYWFSCARLFLEVGYVGIALYVLFFVFCFFSIVRLLKSKETDPLLCYLGMIMTIVCVALTFYNAALYSEAGYMAYFVMALPFAGSSRAIRDE